MRKLANCMNYGRLFSRSWQLVWHHKFLWLLGLAAGLGSIISAPLRLAYSTQITQLVTDPTGVTDPAWADALVAGEPDALLSWLLGGTAVLFVISIGYWLLVTVAQGAMIGAVIDWEGERPSSLRLALRHGVGLLGRFIAIDTLVFFPLFILSLALLLLATGGLLSIAYASMQGSSIESVMKTMTVGVFCMLPFLLLLIPVGMATSVYRTLAFRDTAVCGTGVRESIRHTWQVIRRQWGAVLVLALLLWGLQSVPGMLLSVLTALLAAFTAVSPSATIWLSWIVGLGTAVPLAVLHAYIAVVWTLAYTELQSGKVAE